MMVVKSAVLLAPAIALAALDPVAAVILGCFALLPLIQALRIVRVLGCHPWRKAAVSSRLIRLNMRDQRLSVNVLDGPLSGRQYLTGLRPSPTSRCGVDVHVRWWVSRGWGETPE
jgi:hypothetical protein